MLLCAVCLRLHLNASYESIFRHYSYSVNNLYHTLFPQKLFKNCTFSLEWFKCLRYGFNPFTAGTHYTGFRAKFGRAPEPSLLVITRLLTAGAQ